MSFAFPCGVVISSVASVSVVPSIMAWYNVSVHSIGARDIGL